MKVPAAPRATPLRAIRPVIHAVLLVRFSPKTPAGANPEAHAGGLEVQDSSRDSSSVAAGVPLKKKPTIITIALPT